MHSFGLRVDFWLIVRGLGSVFCGSCWRMVHFLCWGSCVLGFLVWGWFCVSGSELVGVVFDFRNPKP